MGLPLNSQTPLESLGTFNRPWYTFFTEVAAAITPSKVAPTAPTVSASPMTYTALKRGALIVSGGTVSLIEYGRGAVFTTIGVIAGMFDINAGDSLRITYTVAPVLTWVPR